MTTVEQHQGDCISQRWTFSFEDLYMWPRTTWLQCSSHWWGRLCIFHCV